MPFGCVSPAAQRSRRSLPLVRLFDNEAAAYKTDPEAAKSLLGDFAVPSGTDIPGFVGWYAVASALLNLDEVITKN